MVTPPEESQHPAHPGQRQARVIRLPRFIVDEEVGLGDAVKRVTSTAGIKPCGGCLGRAAVLNHRFVLAPRRPR
jgi:hypothetical protein